MSYKQDKYNFKVKIYLKKPTNLNYLVKNYLGINSNRSCNKFLWKIFNMPGKILQLSILVVLFLQKLTHEFDRISIKFLAEYLRNLTK